MKNILTNDRIGRLKAVSLAFIRVSLLLFCTSAFSFSSGKLISQNAAILFDGYPQMEIESGDDNVNEFLELNFHANNFKIDVEDESSVVIKETSESELLLPNDLQQNTIEGKVSDEDGMPLLGVNVIVKGTKTGTMTNFDGEYSLRLPSDQRNVTLVFSYVGYKVKEVAVSDLRIINVQLTPDASSLDEVVVVGYGTAKVRDITGSIASITAAEAEQAPMGSTIESMLQGKAAGVNVSIQSASPTSPISVVIRGASSLSGDNQPLWVIDGVPQYAVSTSGDIANTLYNLNLNDVQSIDVLKDASATAVYGSRAANGVVIVTTKKGTALMSPRIEFSSRVGFQKQNFNDFSYMQADEYINFADAAARESVMTRGAHDYFTRMYLDEQYFFNLNTSEFDKSDLRMLDGAYFPGNTNWQKEMTTNPMVIHNDLSVRGGSERTTFYASFNHKSDEGIIKGGSSKLYGGRLNLDTKIRDRLRFGVNLDASTRKTDVKDGMLSVLHKIRPDIPAFNEDGTIYTHDAYTENPYTTLRNTNKGKGLSLSATGFLEYDVLDNLQLRSAFTNNYSDSETLTYMRSGSQHNYDGSRSWRQTKTSIDVWENTLTYAKMLADRHDINVMGGYSMESSISRAYNMSASNFPDDDILNNFGSAANRANIGESINENSLISQFARLNYKFDDRYIVSGTVRRDGSSRFGSDKRWGFFPSVGAAWLITGEEFMQPDKIKDVFSYLKLRVSTGRTGSQNLGNYDWITRVAAAQYNESPAIIPSSIGNPELQWEQTVMTDFGLDYGLFDDRVRGSFGIYKKKSTDLIYTLPLAPSSSFASIRSNVAAIDNNGVEFDVKYDILRDYNKRLTFDFNIARNKNKVMEINGVVEELFFPNSNSYYMRLKPGDVTGDWWGYQTAGRLIVTAEEAIALKGVNEKGNPTPYRHPQETLGDLYIIDQNKDGVINEDDKVNLGTSVPKAFGGFGFTFEHKGLMINTTFSYAFGHKRLWNLPMSDIGYVGNYNQNNLVAGQSAILLSPYDAKFPRTSQYSLSDNQAFSDIYLKDASYIRLNALNIAYRIPEHYLEGMLLQGIDITFQATNLFTITKYPGFDPQGNWTSSSLGTGMGVDYGTYPSAQTFNLGVKLTLK